jgi:hypothetical protein
MLFQNSSVPSEQRIFFRDLCFLLWPPDIEKTDMRLGETAGISDRMGRNYLRLKSDPSARVREAVLGEARRRIG